LPVPWSSPPGYASPPPAWSWRPSTGLDVLLVVGSATAIGVILLVIWITTTVAGRIAWS
jgi:hypothetical protein